MKLVWVSHSSGTEGGAERCMWEAAAGMTARGHEVHALLPSEGPMRARLERAGSAVTVIPSPMWVHPGVLRRPPYYHFLKRADAHRRAVKILSSFLTDERPDVVMTNTITVPDGAVAANRAGIPHVWYVHEFGREDHGLVYDRGERDGIAFIGRASRRVIVNSHAVRRKFAAHIPDEKLRVVYAGVETPPFVEVPEDGGDSAGPLRLLLLGQIAPGKGQEDAIRAAALLREQGKKVRLDLVGSIQDSGYFERLQRLAHDLGVTEAVRFAGHTEDPYTQFRAADLALVCSRCEAFGRVTAEAMKSGRPVVGADSGGTAELIREGQTGFRYAPGDAEDLARKVGIFHEDRKLLKEMGNHARKWADEAFSMEGYIKALTGVLQESIRSA